MANHFQQSNPALPAPTRNAEIIAYIRWRLQLESQHSSVPLNESLKAYLAAHHNGQARWSLRSAKRYWARKRDFVSDEEISAYPPALWAVKRSAARVGKSITPRKIIRSDTVPEGTNDVGTNLQKRLRAADNAVHADCDSSVGFFVERAAAAAGVEFLTRSAGMIAAQNTSDACAYSECIPVQVVEITAEQTRTVPPHGDDDNIGLSDIPNDPRTLQIVGIHSEHMAHCIFRRISPLHSSILACGYDSEVKLLGVGGFSYVFGLQKEGTPTTALKIGTKASSYEKIVSGTFANEAHVLGQISKCRGASIGRRPAFCVPSTPHAFAVEIGKDLFQNTGLGCVAASDDNPDLWYPVLEMSTVVGVSFQKYSTILATLMLADPVPAHVLSAVADCMASIACCISCLHDMGLAHRDIKPHNILCQVVSSDGPFTFRDENERPCRAMLIDFGLALFNEVQYTRADSEAVKRQKLDATKRATALGTPRAQQALAKSSRTVAQAAAHTNHATNGSSQGEQVRPVHQGDLDNRQRIFYPGGGTQHYMPPEGATASALLDDCTTPEFWFPGDIWAVGIMLGDIFAGGQLSVFNGRGVHDKRVLSEALVPCLWRKYLGRAALPAGAPLPEVWKAPVDLLMKMLRYEPKQRITASAILTHAFISERVPLQERSAMPKMPELTSRDRVPRRVRVGQQ